jgi:lambda repressor-like predicted transcriptional regulator
MANDRLRRAMVKAGVNKSTLAQGVGVDVKTVGKWVEGSVPYPKNQFAIAELLGVDPVDLWPNDHRDFAAAGEIVAAWNRRSDCPPDYWWRLIEQSSEQVDILGYAVLFLSENHPDLITVLTDSMARGCQVRIIVADPNADQTKARDEEEGLDGTLVARIKASVKYLAPLLNTPASIRFQAAPMYNSVFRFDDDMLMTSHLYGTPGRLAPMLHLRRLGAGGLFDQYSGHFERLWAHTTPTQGPA